MASGASSLRFTVEVAADQADRALKAMSVAFNEAGASAKIAMQSTGTTAKAAGGEVVTLGDKIKSVARDQRQEARAASFYVQEIGAIIPMSNSAKIALGGLTEAMVGGVGIGAAVAIITTGIKLMADAWREAGKAANDALDSGARRVDEIKKRIEGDLTPAERIKRQLEVVEDQIAQREQAIPALRARIPSEWRGLTGKTSSQVQAEVAEAQLSQLVREAEALRQELRAELMRAAGAAPKPVSTAFELWDSAAKGPKAAAAKDRIGINPLLGLDDQLGQDFASRSDRQAAMALARQKSYREEVEKTTEASQKWGQVIGSVFGRLAAGQISAKEALAEIASIIVQQVVQVAMATIQANAASAAAGAASSQAPIPIFGPALGIAAMGAMFSAVMGMVGKIGARAMGGSVMAGMPYLVGELGPELVVPGSSGTVIPNHRLASAGGVVVNVAGTVMSARDLEETLVARGGGLDRAMRKLARRRRF